MRTNNRVDHDSIPGAFGVAFNAGYLAFTTEGMVRSDNPYKYGTECCHMWRSGWHHAMALGSTTHDAQWNARQLLVVAP